MQSILALLNRPKSSLSSRSSLIWWMVRWSMSSSFAVQRLFTGYLLQTIRSLGGSRWWPAIISVFVRRFEQFERSTPLGRLGRLSSRSFGWSSSKDGRSVERPYYQNQTTSDTATEDDWLNSIEIFETQRKIVSLNSYGLSNTEYCRPKSKQKIAAEPAD